MISRVLHRLEKGTVLHLQVRAIRHHLLIIAHHPPEKDIHRHQVMVIHTMEENALYHLLISNKIY